MKLHKNSIDEQIANKLQNREANFDNAAWMLMEKLLDKRKKRFFILLPNINKKKGIILMSTLTLIGTSAMLWNSLLVSHGTNTSTYQPTRQVKTIVENTQEGGTAPQKTTAITAFTKAPSSGTGNGSIKQQASKPGILITSASTKTKAIENLDSKISFTHLIAKSKSNNALETEPPITKIVTAAANKIAADSPVAYVRHIIKSKEIEYPGEYEYTRQVHNHQPIKDGWIGVYYNQMQQNTQTWDSVRKGLNLQFMSGNIKPYKHLGIYAGLDWGMLWHGKSKRNQVAINTTNQDSGFTFLRNVSMDFMGKVHLEWNSNKFIAPYINISAGPRLYYTNQTVRTYVNLTEYESSSTNTREFNVSMMAGLGVGARVLVLPHISLDARYEYMIGSQTTQGDLARSTYNGLNYQIPKTQFNPNNGYLRVGLVFNLSEDEYTKTTLREPYIQKIYDTTTVIEYGDTSVIKIECDCDCDTYKTKPNNSIYYENTAPQQPEIYIPQPIERNNETRNRPATKVPSRGKQPFPGTTKPLPPVIRH